MCNSSPTIFPFTVRLVMLPKNSISITNSNVSPVTLPSTIGASPNPIDCDPVILPLSTFKR